MHSTDYYFSRYDISCYKVYIQVDANSAKNKAVYLCHSAPTVWTYKEATFLKKSDDNTEIWATGTKDTSSGIFSIKHVGDGVTYQNNNNGQNYDKNYYSTY